MRRWSRLCQRMEITKPQRPRRQKLSKDLDGGSDSNRSLRHRPIHGHNQVRGQDIRAKQPKHRPTGAINVGWALDHFPYHLTLLKIALHRSWVRVGNVARTLPTLTEKRCTWGYGRSDNSSRSYSPTYTGIFDRFVCNYSSLDFCPRDQTKLATEQPIKDYSIGWALDQFPLQQLCPNCEVHRIIFGRVGIRPLLV